MIVTMVTYITVWWLGGVHLVNPDYELLHSQCVGQQGVLSGLPVLTDTSLKLTSTSSNDQYSTVSLQREVT